LNFELFHTDDIRVEYCDDTRRDIQRVLDDCREERRPYVIIKNECSAQQSCCSEVLISANASNDYSQANFQRSKSLELTRILVPVSMLEEEVYKAEICTYLARKTGAHLILLRARDYGSKAKQNTERIITHIETIAERTGEKISYEELVAKRDSFSFHKDFHLEEWQHDLLLLTASREYGLDDWLFGPPELYAIRHSQVPVMLVNPRADLFSLCD
jgi:hypothetical protein